MHPQVRLPTEAEVWAFAAQVPVPTRDYGLVPITPWGTQRYALRQILKGLAEGIRQFVVDKARQVGMSLLMHLLTVLWVMRYPGLQGMVVADSEKNETYFRDTILTMLEAVDAGTPESEKVDSAGTLRTRNRMALTWPNGSRLLFQNAGPRGAKKLGVGRGLAFFHGTEVSLWARAESLGILRAAFSQVHPAALYVFESTPRGKNWFYDLWQDAADAVTMRQIFLGWWLHEQNRVKRHDPRLARYWDQRLTAREKDWDAQLRQRYQVTLKPEQWTWRRWYVMEEAGGSTRLADSEMPTLPEDGFAASQERPFLDGVGRERLEEGRKTAPGPAPYVYRWGLQLEDTKPETAPAGAEPHLHVWAPPDLRPAVVAAVPAYSAFQDDPTWVVSVWAAAIEQDRLEQVAEFATEAAIGLQPFAWVCLHLAGAYQTGAGSFILEVAGLGGGVLQEIKRLVATGWGTARRSEFRALLGGVHHYIWRRPDSLAAMGALQWKSSAETQGSVLQRLRDQLVRGTLIVRSPALAEELDRLTGAGDGFEPGGREPRGHRAMAAALAVESWAAQLYPTLRRLRAQHRDGASVQDRMLKGFFASFGRRG